MSSKKSKVKNKSPKNGKRVPRKWIAEVVGCAPVTVGQVLDTKRLKGTSDLATRIELADVLLDEKVEQAITDVKKIVHKTNK